ncbi:hypothetical protein [Streptomyces sp. 4N124]|uniref:hypothetical protein n=1 Tax=Streptomyces sp. 4N124 TaxID=3457420 RepID=UPI003FD69C70
MTEHQENELFYTVIEAITLQMARAMDEVWKRPDAARLADSYLDGTLLFAFGRAGVEIREVPDMDSDDSSGA